MRVLTLLTAVLFLSQSTTSVAAEKLVTIRPSASYVHRSDGGHGSHPLAAVSDGKEPKNSNDHTIPRLTFWDHLGTNEWLQLSFDQPLKVSSIDVYWFDDRPKGGCRVPASWRAQVQAGYDWKPVGKKTTVFGVEPDQYNQIVFEPVETKGVRLRIKCQPGFSTGILEIKINGRSQKIGELGRTIDSGGGERKIMDVSKFEPLLPKADPLMRAIHLDWLQQDGVHATEQTLPAYCAVAISELGPASKSFADTQAKLLDAKTPADDKRWMDLYINACDKRRGQRLSSHLKQLKRIVFTKHHDIGGQHYAYTEDISDSPYRDNNPFPLSGKLCLLEMDGLYGKVRTLVDEPEGLVRDPDVSYDGKRILFARRSSMTQDDYHLYEMTVADGKIRQLTSGKGVAEIEPVYLPDGNIIFNSSRCQQIVDCWWADVSNLYMCNSDGKYLRRIGFDQVHTNYPQVLSDGRVIYTRWDYNDRGQLFPQPLFVMNPDGTGQTEFYGNNSWFPTTILHARGIPGTQKVLCVLSGHHTYQKGKLAIIDPLKGRQENSGVQLIAPVRDTPAVKVDKYGYHGEQFQYPFPLSETEYLVTYSPLGSKKGRAKADKPFGVFFMTIDGRRELLVADPEISCNQAIPLAPRTKPKTHPNRVDYTKKTGTYVLQDVYHGGGLKGVERGTIKELRVVALEFRAGGVGSNGNRGPAGGALVSTPISINGAWDVKRILGTTKVYDDGSAAFTVPARTPIYFQALDKHGHAVQTMRSWSTLQPGETFSCVGCHEDKNATPPPLSTATEAMRRGPQALKPFYGPARGFSFAREIQPILDKSCVSCHQREKLAEMKSVISLEGKGEEDSRAQKSWSIAYKTLANRKYVSWTSPQSAPPMLEPYAGGATKSPLLKLLVDDHYGVKLTQEEMDKIACWIDLAVPFSGDYTEGMFEKSLPNYQRYLDKRRQWEAVDAENIKALLEAK